MERSFDVTYQSIDIELVPANLLLGQWPATSYRLVVGHYVPAVFMVSSALLYYFVLVPHVFPYFKPTTDAGIARCRRYRNAHNILLCFYSALCSVGTFLVLRADGQLGDRHRLLCAPVEGTILRPLSVTFTLSKLIEWMDTVWLVWLGSSPPKFLHLYHHATTFWLFCFVMNMPGPEKMGLLLNGAVHTLMYGHYYRPFPKPWVPFITVAQIAQLATVTYIYTINPAACGSEASFARGPEEHLLAFLTPYSMVPVFLWLFCVFFVKRFVLKKPKEDNKKQE